MIRKEKHRTDEYFIIVLQERNINRDQPQIGFSFENCWLCIIIELIDRKFVGIDSKLFSSQPLISPYWVRIWN